ncbi:MAG TPA: hypothetical protein PKC03_06510 [Dokdonella sp.]|nr:hypothetical protein [Dokdonella sp.]
MVDNSHSATTDLFEYFPVPDSSQAHRCGYWLSIENAGFAMACKQPSQIPAQFGRACHAFDSGIALGIIEIEQSAKQLGSTLFQIGVISLHEQLAPAILKRSLPDRPPSSMPRRGMR